MNESLDRPGRPDGRRFADYLIGDPDAPVPPRQSGQMPEYPHPEPGGTVFMRAADEPVLWSASWQNGPGMVDIDEVEWETAVAWARARPAKRILVDDGRNADVSLEDFERSHPRD
jgi:hypothetical protein